MKNNVRGFRKFFNGFETAGYLLCITLIISAYIFLLTQQVFVSLVVGVIGSVFTFHHSVFLPKQTMREQALLEELQKYSTTMTFYLQAGHNVFSSLEMSKRNLDQQIQGDIQRTIDILQREAVLDTSHFKKYNFSAIDIFHQILDVKYQVGGSAKDLFTQVNQNVNFEIVKRDELFRRKGYVKKKLYLMMAIVLGIPVLLATLANELYAQFLTGGIFSIGLVVGLFSVVSISLFFVQRNATDISIYE